MNVYERELGTFEQGVLSCWKVWEQDSRLLNVQREEEQRRPGYVPPPEPKPAPGVQRRPLWQRISELTSEGAERSMRPHVRRQRIRKLLKTVDQILREELKPVTIPAEASTQEKEALVALKAERSVFWDPLPEVCFYLEIGQSKLAQYARQTTGLGAKDLVDRIRVENLRAAIRERLRKVADRLQEFTKNDVRQLSVRDGAGVLLKALKGSEHFVSRQEMALSVGIASKARLYRACLACERLPLEELERQEAEKVFAETREHLPAPAVPEDAAKSAAQENPPGVDGVGSNIRQGGAVLTT